MDGWAQAGGPHVFDETNESSKNGQSGTYLAPIWVEYRNLSHPAELQLGWTVDRIVKLNLLLRNSTHANPEVYTKYVPRGSPKVHLPINEGPVHAVLGETVNAHAGITADDKAHLLEQAILFYHEGLGKSTIDMGASSNPRRAMGGTLRPLATLYARMAEIHAFVDSNSRTRTMVLNAEVTRLGGHPLLLFSSGVMLGRADTWRWCSMMLDTPTRVDLLRLTVDADSRCDGSFSSCGLLSTQGGAST